MKLDGLQQKLHNYNETNKNMILEEEDGQLDTSNRIRINDATGCASHRKNDEDDNQSIIFEKLSRVSSMSKL